MKILQANWVFIHSNLYWCSSGYEVSMFWLCDYSYKFFFHRDCPSITDPRIWLAGPIQIIHVCAIHRGINGDLWHCRVTVGRQIVNYFPFRHFIPDSYIAYSIGAPEYLMFQDWIISMIKSTSTGYFEGVFLFTQNLPNKSQIFKRTCSPKVHWILTWRFARIYRSNKRVSIQTRIDVDYYQISSTAICYAWYCWKITNELLSNVLRIVLMKYIDIANRIFKVVIPPYVTDWVCDMFVKINCDRYF